MCTPEGIGIAIAIASPPQSTRLERSSPVPFRSVMFRAPRSDRPPNDRSGLCVYVCVCLCESSGPCVRVCVRLPLVSGNGIANKKFSFSFVVVWIG